MDTISYKEAARDFEEAFPVGNGRIGAKVFGGVSSQRLALNEESLWSAPFINRVNKNCRKDFSQIKSLFAEGKDYEAQELVKDSIASVPSYPSYYKSAGSFRIDFFSSAERTPLSFNSDSGLVYERKLDMETGIASESFSIESTKDSTAIFSQSSAISGGSSVSYSREVFASSRDDVIAIHIGASLPRNIFLRAYFESDEETRTVFSLDDDTIVLERTNGIPMCAMAMACISGGSCNVKGGSLIIEGADDATIYIDIETAYRSNHYRRRGGNVSRTTKSLATSCSDKALKKLCFVQAKPYQSVRDDHAFLFSRKYRRLSVQLSDEKQERDWKFNRYKLLSSFNNLGTLPPLSTGLWTDPESSETPRFKLKDLYASPLCEYGLEKAFSSLERYIKSFKKRSFKCAREMFQDDGSIAYEESDIWGDSAPSAFKYAEADDPAGKNIFAPFGAVYAALSIKKYYDYTFDRKFLKKNFSLLSGPCEFFANFEAPAAYSIKEKELLRKLFESAMDAARELGRAEKHPEIQNYLAKLNAEKADKESGSSGQTDKAEESEKTPSSLNGIIRSWMNKGKVEIEILGGDIPSSGEVKGLHLPGNLRGEIVWKQGSPKGGRIYAKPNCIDYAKSIVLHYNGKSYPSDLLTGSIDILNILPTTV